MFIEKVRNNKRYNKRKRCKVGGRGSDGCSVDAPVNRLKRAAPSHPRELKLKPHRGRRRLEYPRQRLRHRIRNKVISSMNALEIVFGK